MADLEKVGQNKINVFFNKLLDVNFVDLWTEAASNLPPVLSGGTSQNLS